MWQLVELGNREHESGESCGRGSQSGCGGEVVLGSYEEAVAAQRWERLIFVLEALAPASQDRQTCCGAGTLEVLRGTAQEELVFCEGWRACCGGVGTELVLVEGDGYGRVGGKVQLGVSLSPVPVRIGWISCRDPLDVSWRCLYLITAILTGAVTLAL